MIDPVVAEFVIAILLPGSLMFMMLGLGAGLTPHHLVAPLRRPWPYIVGLFGQMLMLPAAAFGVAIMARLEPTLAIGLVIIAAAPGGIASNVVTVLVRGDMALSVLLTLTSSLLGVITMPLLVGLALDLFGGKQQSIDLPLIDTIRQLMTILVAPLAVGLVLRLRKPTVALQLATLADKSAAPFLVFVLIILTAGSIDFLRHHIAAVGLLVVGYLGLMLVLSFALVRLAGLDGPAQRTVTIEVMLQNSSLALLVALDLLGSEEFAIVPGCYALIMLLFVALLVPIMRKRAMVD
jgi:BASS family bile acid:Na+ symporter